MCGGILNCWIPSRHHGCFNTSRHGHPWWLDDLDLGQASLPLFSIKSHNIILDNTYLVGGWPQPLRKNDGVSNSWDDDIPNIWKVIKFPGSSHHQPDIIPVTPYCYSIYY